MSESKFKRGDKIVLLPELVTWDALDRVFAVHEMYTLVKSRQEWTVRSQRRAPPSLDEGFATIYVCENQFYWPESFFVLAEDVPAETDVAPDDGWSF